MPQGLQTWDENGNLTVDITDRLTRVLGQVDASISSPKSGSITVPSEYYSGNQIFATVLATSVTPQGDTYGSIDISGQTITYSNLRSTMVYGVF